LRGKLKGRKAGGGEGGRGERLEGRKA